MSRNSRSFSDLNLGPYTQRVLRRAWRPLIRVSFVTLMPVDGLFRESGCLPKKVVLSVHPSRLEVHRIGEGMRQGVPCHHSHGQDTRSCQYCTYEVCALRNVS
jgi:hypothetical protein